LSFFVVGASADERQNADKIVTSSAGCDIKYTNVSVSASTTYTASFWVKLTSGTGLQGRFYDNINGANIEYYIYDSQITIGEWSRVTRTFTTPSGCTNIQVWYLASSSSVSVTAHFWGFQLEEGAYTTSYIPTLGAAVTRGADSCIKTGISSLIGQTEGTLFGEFNVLANQESQSIWIRQASGGLYNEFLFMLTNNAQQPRVQVVTGGVTQFDHTASSISVGYHKFAFAYKQNDFAFYIDGVQIATSSSGLVPTCNEMYLGTYPDGGTRQTSQKQALLFKTRLSNQELQDLTTL
jgi:hypothetical protein